MGSLLASGPDSVIWWSWVGDHRALILQRLVEHVDLALPAVAVGAAIALPLAVLARRYRWLATPVLGATGVLYAIPSLALLFLLGPLTGYTTQLTAEVALTSYTLLILVRNTLIGLQGVSPEVLEAATGMGYSPIQRLLRVELPIALPSIIAGIRIATVTVIGLVTIATLIGLGGLGALIYDGLQRDFSTPAIVGSVLSVVLAVAADALLLGLQVLLTPWARRRRRGPDAALPTPGGPADAEAVAGAQVPA